MQVAKLVGTFLVAYVIAVVSPAAAVFWGATVPGGSYHSVFNGPQP